MGRRSYRDPNKADGRNLRKAIREHLKEINPDLKSRFTIRTIVDKTYESPDAAFEVIFDQNDPTSMDVMDEVDNWIKNEWWPQNKQWASTIIKEWDRDAQTMIPRDIPVVDVTVVYGLLHERRGHY